MKSIPMNEHLFEKINLVSLKDGSDDYKCLVCGCKGNRKAFTEFVTVSEEQAKIAAKCKCEKSDPTPVRRPKKVLLDKMLHIGIPEDGVYEVIEAPAHYLKYANDVWVMSPTRKEAVRILPNEIIDKEY